MFKDTSIFSGVKEFKTYVGTIRAMKEGAGSVGIYVLEDNNFIRKGTIFINFGESCYKIFQVAQKNLDLI